MFRSLLPALLLLGSFPLGAWAEEDVDYTQDIKPILSRRCYSCHGTLKQRNELRLDTAALAKKGGIGGPAVVPGNLQESLLLDAIQGANGVPQMPPEGEPLTAEQIGLIKRWIETGAKSPSEVVPVDPSKHWAYQPPVRGNPPPASDPAWSQNPIDAYIAAGHSAQGLQASPQAAKNVLLRRVYLDLVGLPPTADELRSFLADNSADAYEKVVDRLLDSPQYGERWGRHWMDVWRYSDWDGYGAEVRESKPHIWRWRDWIVESLNADRGYDQMVREMLAGDELAPEDPQTVRATGFLVRNWFSFNRNVWLDATIEHTSKAFLGTTLNCARCHDHMYDPITQPEYYQFRAFFESHDVRTDRVPGQTDLAKDGLVRVYDAKADTPTFLFRRGDDKQPVTDQPLAAGVPGVFRASDLKVEPVALSPQAYYPGIRDFQQTEAQQLAQRDFENALLKRNEGEARLQEARKTLADFVASQGATPEKKPPTVAFLDDFSAKKDDAWKVDSGEWTWADGKLRQQTIQNAWTGLLAIPPHPTDCVIRVKLKSTGGQMYKSVGICFDYVDSQNFQGVYVSVSGKVQIFHHVKGQDAYPATGMKALPIEVGREYDLQVAVAGRLVNVSVDGALLVAYELPADRPTTGRFGLFTFDASAEFSRVEVTNVPADFALVSKIGEAPVPKNEAQSQQAVVVAERQVAFADRVLATALANRLWVQARIAADKAMFANPPSPQTKELAATAALAEKEYILRLAEQQLADAERKLAEAKRTPGNVPPITVAEMAIAMATKARQEALEASRQPGEAYTKFGAVYPATSSGRRLALAQWIANKSNPLTARVAINHIWLRHLGSPLVPTVFDFGLNGKAPTHPELLDWLAVELMDHDWKMKPIHRLIVTSQAYQQQSQAKTADDSNKSRDPENLYLWRTNPRRLEAEAVRDATLVASGNLDLTRGGPELDENAGLQTPRRSLYFRNSKEKKMTFLDTFDRPNVVDCYRRSESIVPQQALALANSSLAIAESRRLAARLTEQAGPANETANVAAFITNAFEQILARSPNASERTECEAFLTAQTQKYSQPEGLTKFTAGVAAHVPASDNPHQRARENLVHVLFNHNDFITVR